MAAEEHKVNIWSRISFWFRREARYYHKDFIRGIKNLIRWFPVIWRDRDWDHSYIWDILMKKLSFQADFTRHKGCHLYHIRDAERMELAVRLIKRVSDEYYTGIYDAYIKSEIGYEPISKEDLESIGDDVNYGSELKTVTMTTVWEDFDSFFAKYPHAYREVTKQDKYFFDNDTKQRIAMNMGIYMDEKANRILFTLLQRYIKTWWD
jgi:hypothetical protein